MLGAVQLQISFRACGCTCSSCDCLETGGLDHHAGPHLLHFNVSNLSPQFQSAFARASLGWLIKEGGANLTSDFLTQMTRGPSIHPAHRRKSQMIDPGLVGFCSGDKRTCLFYIGIIEIPAVQNDQRMRSRVMFSGRIHDNTTQNEHVFRTTFSHCIKNGMPVRRTSAIAKELLQSLWQRYMQNTYAVDSSLETCGSRRLSRTANLLDWLGCLDMPEQQALGDQARKRFAGIGVAQYLFNREVLIRSSSAQKAAAYRIYQVVVPDVSTRLQAPGTTSAHFTPDGRFLVGIHGSNSSVTVWSVRESISATQQPGLADRGPRAQLPATTSVSRASTDEEVPSGSQPLPSQPPTFVTTARPSVCTPTSERETLPAVASTAARPSQPTPRVTSTQPAHGHSASALTGVAVQQPEYRSTQLQCAPSSACSGPCAHSCFKRKESLRIAWRQRASLQQELVSEWERERRRRRASAAKCVGTVKGCATQVVPVTGCLQPPTPKRQPARLPPPSTPPLDLSTCTPALPLTARYTQSVASSGQRLISGACMFTPSEKSMLLATETPAAAGNGAGDTDAERVASSILLVSLADGAVLDCVRFPGERLLHRQGRATVAWSLHDRLLAVLLRKAQSISLYHISDTSFGFIQTIGQYALPDDVCACDEAAQQQAAFLCDPSIMLCLGEAEWDFVASATRKFSSTIRTVCACAFHSILVVVGGLAITICLVQAMVLPILYNLSADHSEASLLSSKGGWSSVHKGRKTISAYHICAQYISIREAIDSLERPYDMVFPLGIH
jgi:hypothetical protein